MAIKTAQVAVDGTADLLTKGGFVGAVRNSHATAILYVGDSEVTTATGFGIPGGQTLSFELGPSEDLYGITDGTAVTAHVFRRT